MEQSSKAKVYVGMDVHKDSIEIALAAAGGGEVRRFGRIGGERKAFAGAVRKLESAHGRSLVFVYEAGPCGYGIHRFLVQRGHPCWVVAPSMTPRRSSDRVKTDRRDADKLARLARAGELTAVYVPDAHDEAIRDLVRTREDAVAMQRQARQRLKALLLRHDVRYVGKSSWTPAHRRWLAEEVKMPHGAQQIAFEEYVQAVDDATARIERMITAIGAEIEHWRWAPVVAALQALRGVQLIHAVTLIAELGDLSRFESARQLMGYLGLVPSQDSTGARRRQGAITKSGNGHARKALVEAAWAYQHRARVSAIIARRQAGLPKAACEIAWQAQLRLCAKFRRLAARRMLKQKIVVAVARELSGFVWAIAREVAPR
jgi:transposase